MRMRFLLLLFIFYGAFSVWAQVHTFLNVQVENDYINWWGNGSDRFYTGGNFISLQRVRQHKLIRSFGVELVQKAYTPSNLQTSQVEEMDYPYAGLFYIRQSIVVVPIQCKWAFLGRLSYGTSGPRSGVAQFQVGLHHLIGDEAPLGWFTMKNSYPFRQVELSFNFPLQLSNRFSLGLVQLVEGGTFFNRWVGQGWIFWGDQPLPFFPAIDGIIIHQAAQFSDTKKVFTGLFLSGGFQHIVRDRIVEEGMYNKTVQVSSLERFSFLRRTTPTISGIFFIKYQRVALQLSQNWRVLSIVSLPAHFFGAIGFSFQL